MRHHPECTACCAKERCHWCLLKVGTHALRDAATGYTYYACPPHAQLCAMLPQSSTLDVALAVRNAPVLRGVFDITILARF